MVLVKVTHGCSRFYVKTRKENNTYLIHQFIIGNAALIRLILTTIFVYVHQRVPRDGGECNQHILHHTGLFA